MSYKWLKFVASIATAGLLVSLSRIDRVVYPQSSNIEVRRDRRAPQSEHVIHDSSLPRIFRHRRKDKGVLKQAPLAIADYNEIERTKTTEYYLPDPSKLGPGVEGAKWAQAMLQGNTQTMPKFESKRKPSVLIIGSGPAGLAMLRALSQLKGADSEKHPVDFACYDRQPVAGGMWTGDRRFSPMYHGMWLNGASYYTEYPSYPYSEHYGRRIPSYFPREVVADYIGGYTKKNALDQYITHGVNVLGVKWVEELQQFEVTSEIAELPPKGTTFDNARMAKGKSNRSENVTKVEFYDYVTIATGTFNEPRGVSTPGFTGEQVHAREWIGGEGYKGKNVVIVGGGDSATDMVLLLLKYGANRVVQAIRSFEKDGYNEVYDDALGDNVEKKSWDDSWSEGSCIASFPFTSDSTKSAEKRNEKVCRSYKGISLRGGIDHAEGRSVYFKNGTAVHDIDAIVYATGYRSQGSYDGFVAPDLRLVSGQLYRTYDKNSGVVDLHFPGQLHLDVLFHANPRLFYLAQNTLIYSYLEYENKAAYLAGVVTGLVPLPTPAAIAAEASDGPLRQAIWESWADSAELADPLDSDDDLPETESPGDYDFTVVAAQLWRQAEYVRELGRRPSEIRAAMRRGIGMVKGILAERQAVVNSFAETAENQGDNMKCPCNGNVPFAEWSAAWHDYALPASPITGDYVIAPASETTYINLTNHSVSCFLNASLCA